MNFPPSKFINEPANQERMSKVRPPTETALHNFSATLIMQLTAAAMLNINFRYECKLLQLLPSFNAFISTFTTKIKSYNNNNFYEYFLMQILYSQLLGAAVI